MLFELLLARGVSVSVLLSLMSSGVDACMATQHGSSAQSAPVTMALVGGHCEHVRPLVHRRAGLDGSQRAIAARRSLRGARHRANYRAE